LEARDQILRFLKTCDKLKVGFNGILKKEKMMGKFFCVGIAFYAGIGMIAGYSFWFVVSVFFGVLLTGVVTQMGIDKYGDIVHDSQIFNSHRSWFYHFNYFLENDFAEFDDRVPKNWNKSVAVLLLFLPLLGIALSMITAVLLFVLFLDWLRLAFIGFANLCIAITLRDVAWAYVFGTILGAGISWLLVPTSGAHLALGGLISGLVFVGFFFYKEKRKTKYGTPYFPT
jgi:hypothetical protein